MIFSSKSTDDAAGSILAHSLKVSGQTLKKGRTLAPSDIKALQDAGVENVIVATLEAGDLHEDEAAAAIASSLAGANTTFSEPFTGRSNIYGDADGLAVIDEERLHQINRLDESLTVATLPRHSQSAARQMLATVKIIPFAVPKTIIDQAVKIAKAGDPIVSLSPFRVGTADLILTRLPHTKPSILDKTVAVISGRLKNCNAQLGEILYCGHAEDEVASSVASLRGRGNPLLIFGASAIVDRLDVIPAGLQTVGGEVVHLGMPVDPGNLLMLGSFGNVPVVGVPSCARSPKLNGFDWVLQRILADVKVGREDIMSMGVGGLLKEIPSRPRPRENTDDNAGGKSEPRIAAIILGAGRSTRMGETNKLLKELDGVPVIRRTVQKIAQSRVSEIVVVTGHETELVEQALEGLNIRFVQNPDYKQGISSSLKQGINTVSKTADGAIVALGDMPFISPASINKLVSAFDPEEGRGICVPQYRRKRGNPILWGAEFFDAMQGLSGDIGAKHLMAEFSESVCEVEISSRSILIDLDTPEAFENFENGTLSNSLE